MMRNPLIHIVTLAVICNTALIQINPTFAQEDRSPSSKEQQDFDFANGLYQRKNYDTAAEVFAKFIQEYPGSEHRKTAMFRRAESLYQHSLKQSNQNPVDAKVVLIEAQFGFQEYIKFAPKGDKILDALLRHGEISYKLDDYKRGLTSLERVLNETEEKSQTEAALFYAARCHEALEQYQQAEEKYQTVRGDHTKGEFAAFSTYLLAQLYEKMDQVEKATALLNQLWKNEEQYVIPEDSNLIEKTQLLSAQLLYRMERFEDAAESYLAYIDENPDGEHAQEAKYGAAWSLYRQKLYNEALAVANTLKREMLNPELLAGILFLQGTCSYQQKQYADAIPYFKEVIADPNAGEYKDRAWYQLCWSYFLTNNFEQVVNQARLMLEQELDPSMSSNVHYLLGQALARQDRLAEAAEEMRLVFSIQEDGEYAEDAMYLLGDLLYRLERYEESSKTFMNFANRFTGSNRVEDVLIRAVNAQFNAKQYALAVSTTERLLNQFPNTSKRQDLLYRKGLALYQLDQMEAAMDTFAVVIHAENSSDKKDDALYWTAYIHERNQNRETASEVYSRLIREYPHYKNIGDVRLRKAYCDYKTGAFDKAYQEFHALLFDESKQELTPEIVFWLIVHCDEKGNHKEALRIAKKAYSLFDDPSVRERALVAQGTQMIALEQWNEALSLAQTFKEQYTDSQFQPERLWIQAKGYEGLNQKDQALALFEESLLASQNQGSPDPALEAAIYVDRGKILYEKEEYKDALESFLRVSILYNHEELTPEAMFLAIQCHLAMDEPGDAQIMYNDMLQNYADHLWTKKAKEAFANQIHQTNPANQTASGTP